MLAVALAALRARRSSSLALWLLAVLVTVAAVGAPYYLLATLDRTVGADVDAAPPAQRLVELSRQAPIQANPASLQDAFTIMDKALTLPDATEVSGLRASVSIGGAVAADLAVATRDEVCAHVTVDGACPAGTGDVMISRSLAAVMGVHVGDQIDWPAAVEGRQPKLRVVGLYQPTDPDDPYWGSGLLAAAIGGGTHTADAMFVTRDTLLANASIVTCERQYLITVATMRALGPDTVRAVLANTRMPESEYGSQVSFDVAPLVTQIDTDIARLRTAIPLLAVEVVLLGWFALSLVLRAVATARRPDVGLLLLRGTPRLRMWWLLTLQSAVPVLAGVPFGAALGWFGARLLVGPVPAVDAALAAAVAGGAVLVVLVGALIAAGAAERRSRRTPIPDLLRRTPARRRGWRADVADVIVLALAGFGLVQTKLAGPAAAGIVALTPALIALAVGLIAGRLLGPLARRLIVGGLRAGRPVPVLTATYLARRGGLDRVVALLVISVTLCATATMAWHATDVAQQHRAAIEVGADEVMEVRDASAARLLAAVRAADPGGRYLMAVATITDPNIGVPVLAVDSPRLAAVLSAGGWPAGADIARVLRPVAPAPVEITGGGLRLVAQAVMLPRNPLDVLVTVTDGQAGTHTAVFGPLSAGTATYTADLPGCLAGCALDSLQLVSEGLAATTTSSGQTVDVVLRSLEAPGGTVTPAVDLTDRTRWHTSITPDVYGPILSTGPDGLRVGLLADEKHGGGVLFDPRVFPVDTPLPLPAVAVGTLGFGQLGGVTTVSPLGDLITPIHVARTVPLLPRAAPSGVYVDLEYAVRVDAGAGTGARGQVWIRAGTPDSVMSALRGSGLTLAAVTTQDAVRQAYRRQATESTLWFTLIGALIGLLIGVVALLLVAAAERDARRAEFAALRRQGVRAATVRRAALAGYGVLALVAVAVGLVAVGVDLIVTGAHPMIFSDGWHVVPPPAPGSGLGWPLAACAGVPLLAAAYLSARRLAAGTAPGTAAGSGPERGA